MVLKRGLKPLMQNFYLDDFSLWPNSRKELRYWEKMSGFLGGSAEFNTVEVPMDEDEEDIAGDMLDMLKTTHKDMKKRYKMKVIHFSLMFFEILWGF
jgi:hypothetical protein